MPVGIITEARALRADELPREIIRRHDEMNRLADALRPAVDGDSPQTTFFEGPSGAGKTTVARRGVEKLKAKVLDIDVAYVECWDRTTTGALRRVVDQIIAKPIHDNAGRETLMGHLRDHDRQVIVILDEADQLADFGIIHDLYDCRQTTLLGIVNRLEPWYSRLDERIQSRASAAIEVHFDAYTDDELAAILQDRVDWGLAPNAVASDTVEYIARQADGDARKAVSILRHAARDAERDGRDQITDAVVDEVLGAAETDVKEISLAKLSTNHRRLYEVLTDAELTPAEMYAAYKERDPQSRGERHVRDLRKKLEDYELVERLGHKKNRRYTAVEP
jgi:cell division control protein 6